MAQSVDLPARQFRGVWIATVVNLDWPSAPGIPVEQMKSEFRQHLDMLHDLGMNAAIVQVRPSGDAMYPSRLEPWSKYLTGRQGEAPPGGFDPLQFMISETHARGLEFHAWFNPFRGIRDVETTEVAQNHVIHQHPEWFVRYGDHLYFDPGLPEVRQFCLDVIMDVVGRYDVDAVHFDDYFYPYRLVGEEFPDIATFSAFGGAYFPDRKDDWRRENINRFIRRVHESLEETKPWVHFGISPFGVWRNKKDDPRGSETATLQTNYDDLYGDALKWVTEGWLDYVLPQCYQYLGRDIMDYRAVTRWWSDNHGSVNFFIGQSPYRLGRPERGGPWMVPNEIERQLIYHDSVPDLKGSAFFRSSTFFDNPMGLNDILRERFFKYPALPPVAFADRSRENKNPPTGVSVSVDGDTVEVTVSARVPGQVRWYVLYQSGATDVPARILAISPSRHLRIGKEQAAVKGQKLYVTTIDRYRVESNPAEIRLVVDD